MCVSAHSAVGLSRARTSLSLSRLTRLKGTCDVMGSFNRSLSQRERERDVRPRKSHHISRRWIDTDTSSESLTSLYGGIKPALNTRRNSKTLQRQQHAHGLYCFHFSIFVKSASTVLMSRDLFRFEFINI
jgi:hypothetical protein